MSFSNRHKELFKFGNRHLGRGLAKSNQFIASRAAGCKVWDFDGNEYLDFTSGIGVLSTGHCHPAVVKAVKDQAEKLVHNQINIAMNEPIINLTKSLLSIIPKQSMKKAKSLDTFVFSNTGAEAVENAIKIARYKTGKQNILCCLGSYHGRSNATAACTSSKVIYRKNVGPFMPGIFFFPHPYISQMPSCMINLPQERVDFCINQLKLLLKQQSAPEDTAAILIEPVLGEGGYVVPPRSYLESIQEICNKNGILLIVDEVQTGFGRTGKFFCYEHFPTISPDIVVMAKGIASGYPMSAVVSTKEIMDSLPPMSLGGTYVGNAVSCSAAIATIETIKKENLVEKTVKNGLAMKEMLFLMKSKYSVFIKDVRGLGLMLAMEFNTVNCPNGISGLIVKECAKRGLLIMSCGAFETIRLIPPLIVGEKEIEKAQKILSDVLKIVLQK